MPRASFVEAPTRDCCGSCVNQELVTAPYNRTAAAALDDARPVIDRLDIARDPEDIAADLIEAWEASQRALRGLAGNSALRGQLLIREARQRELLSLDQAHALVDFAAAADRSDDRATARPLFAQVARDNPDLALPHIYLGRMTREEGDVAGAARELATAVRLDPKSALAQREMGAHLLASATTHLNQGNTNG